MSIWEAFCSPNWRVWYEKALIAKGLSPVQMRVVMDQFFHILHRIKSAGLSRELENINDPLTFKGEINHIFNDLWKDYIGESYSNIQDVFLDYLNFLAPLQSFKGKFFSEEAEKSLNKRFPKVPIEQLSSYETDYLQNGKLTLLTNPLLLSWIRFSIASELVTVKNAHSLCLRFYGNLLPDMKSSDYAQLVKMWWKPEGRSNKFLLTYPDGMQELYHSEDAVRAVILFYGAESVISRHIKIRSRDFLVNRIPFDHPEEYTLLDSSASYYFCTLGGWKDRLNVMNAANLMLGKKLKIDLTL